MKTALEIMTKDPITVTIDTDITEAARIMLEKKFNGLPVVDSVGRLQGIICQSDLVGMQKTVRLPSFFTLLDGFLPLSSTKSFEDELKKIAATTVGDAMTKKVTVVEPSATIREIADLMVVNKLHTLPVVDGDNLVGIIGKEDVLRELTS